LLLATRVVGVARRPRSNILKSPFRILCAVDASPPAATAFEQALAMSAHRGAQLVLVHAVSKEKPYSWGAVERVAALAALRERAEAQNVLVRVRVQHGDIARVILLHARAQAPDLIVLGSHEPVGLARLRFRSIADRVVKGASCPVLLIPAATTHVTPTFRNVICAIDLSSQSPAAVANAARLVGDSGGLTLLHVFCDSTPRQYALFGVPEFSTAMVRDARQRLHSILHTQELDSDVLVTVTSNSVHDEILRVASEMKADLIVMGATRRAGLRRRFFGSTALRVSRRSPLPVLILPAVHLKRDLSTLDEAALGWAA
jgi:nucleotide-binding universal stress UspA family protein